MNLFVTIVTLQVLSMDQLANKLFTINVSNAIFYWTIVRYHTAEKNRKFLIANTFTVVSSGSKFRGYVNQKAHLISIILESSFFPCPLIPDTSDMRQCNSWIIKWNSEPSSTIFSFHFIWDMLFEIDLNKVINFFQQ